MDDDNHDHPDHIPPGRKERTNAIQRKNPGLNQNTIRRHRWRRVPRKQTVMMIPHKPDPAILATRPREETNNPTRGLTGDKNQKNIEGND